MKLLCWARHAVALTAGGQVLTWGISSQGQLGRIAAFGPEGEQPSAADVFLPKPVPGLEELLGSKPADIGVGMYNTFAISSDGDVVGFGLNNSGQLGVPKKGEQDNLVWTPIKIDGLKQISDVRGGEQHTLALTRGGRVMSFGAATYGMLGRAGLDVANASQSYSVPTEIEATLDGAKVWFVFVYLGYFPRPNETSSFSSGNEHRRWYERVCLLHLGWWPVALGKQRELPIGQGGDRGGCHRPGEASQNQGGSSRWLLGSEATCCLWLMTRTRAGVWLPCGAQRLVWRATCCAARWASRTCSSLRPPRCPPGLVCRWCPTVVLNGYHY